MDTRSNKGLAEEAGACSHSPCAAPELESRRSSIVSRLRAGVPRGVPERRLDFIFYAAVISGVLFAVATGVMASQLDLGRPEPPCVADPCTSSACTVRNVTFAPPHPCGKKFVYWCSEVTVFLGVDGSRPGVFRPGEVCGGQKQQSSATAVLDGCWANRLAPGDVEPCWHRAGATDDSVDILHMTELSWEGQYSAEWRPELEPLSTLLLVCLPLGAAFVGLGIAWVVGATKSHGLASEDR